MRVELHFPLRGRDPIPADHGYAVLGAVTQVVPTVHSGNGFAVAPIAGRQIGGRRLSLTPTSRLVIRVDADRIAEFLPLAGKRLDIAGRSVTVGAPTVRQLRPAAAIKARIVTIKGFFEPDPFTEAVRRQLDRLGVAEAVITPGRQRTLRIKENEILGFETVLSGLSEADSIAVQSVGIGGRRHMGCGVFVPAKENGDGNQD